MKRSIDSVSGRTSPPSSPPPSPPSPRRRRLGASSSAGPSELHRPDDAPSSRPPSPDGGLDEPSARRAGVLPAPHRAATLSDLPRSAFARITQRLDSRDIVDLAMAHPRALAPIVSEELSEARIELAAERVDTLAHFASLLGAGAHAAADTVLSIDGQPRANALEMLVGRLPALPADDRFPAFALAAQAVHELNVRHRSQVIHALLEVLLEVPPEQRHDAWHALLPAIESVDLAPGSPRIGLTESWVVALENLRETHHDDAAQTAFDALARLPLAHQSPILGDLLATLTSPLARIRPPTVHAAFEAIARLPVQSRHRPLRAMASVVKAVAPGDPHAVGESERRSFVRALRQAIAELPAEQRIGPLTAVASRIEQLPVRERHLELHALLRETERLVLDGATPAQQGTALDVLNAQIAHLAVDARAAAWRSARGLSLELGRAADIEPWETLMNQVEHMQPGRRLDMLRDTYSLIAPLTDAERERPAPAYARIAPATDAQRGELLPALLAVHRLDREPERVSHFDRGLRWTSALPAEHRLLALDELVSSIRELPVEAYRPATERLFGLITADLRPQRNAAFDALIEAVGGLARDGFPEGFDILLAGIGALPNGQQPQLLFALTQGADHWPEAGQSDRFIAVTNAALAHGPVLQGAVLSVLADRVVSLPDDERETFMSLAVDMASALPPPLPRMPLERVANAIDKLPEDERPRVARRLLAAVLALPDPDRADAFHSTVETFGKLAAEDRWAGSFEPLLAAVAAEPVEQRTDPLDTLIGGVTRWPAGDQPRLMAALRAQLPALRVEHRARLVSSLVNLLDSLNDDARPAEADALREAIAALPAAYRDAPTALMRVVLGED